MATNDTIVVNISRLTQLPTRQTFGTILLAAYHDLPGQLVRSYSSISEIEADFDPALEPYLTINRMANAAFSQPIRPSLIKVGKRTQAFTQILDITVKAPQGAGFVWTIPVDGETISYTELVADDIDAITTGLITALNLATASVSAAPDTAPAAFLTLTADNPGEVHQVIVDLIYFDLVDQTADPGIAADLSAIRGQDEEFYSFSIDSQSPAEVAAAATWAETRTVFFAADAYGSDPYDPLVTTDVASVLQTAQRNRSFLYWARPGLPQLTGSSTYHALAAIAEYFAGHLPGEATFKFRQPTFATAGALPTGKQLDLEGKLVNHAEENAGISSTYEGKVSSGEFADIIVASDVISARIYEAVFGVLITEEKVAFTDEDLELLAAQVRGVLNGFVPEILAPGSVDVVVPLVVDIPAADRAERKLTIKFTATFSGAVHTVTITGTLEV